MTTALPALSLRNDAIAPFQTMELVKSAQALEASGRSIIHMSIGEPDFTATPSVIEALNQALANGKSQYTPALGIAPLREAIATHYLRTEALVVDPACVIVTAGASAALTLACLALVNPGDEVLLTDPSYPCNRHFVAAANGIPKTIPVGAETMRPTAGVSESLQPLRACFAQASLFAHSHDHLAGWRHRRRS
ncbi:MAG: aminotransferase class I/II-fold pyridoxal phosphate-dependent enzyme [Betaproteobacteria bacterium]|nr:aminotransferase class I/II-fold pyridoxal phosphate-dependent enzyme [Betaproteobacteria bacterium]